VPDDAAALSALFPEGGAESPAAGATTTPLAGAAADQARKALELYNTAIIMGDGSCAGAGHGPRSLAGLGTFPDRVRS